jgi:hypothetical protein
MATNGPLAPSMIFKSRTTKQSSNVMEQNACSRSLLSSMSLMRTSVISTSGLLRRLAAADSMKFFPPANVVSRLEIRIQKISRLGASLGFFQGSTGASAQTANPKIKLF